VRQQAAIDWHPLELCGQLLERANFRSVRHGVKGNSEWYLAKGDLHRRAMVRAKIDGIEGPHAAIFPNLTPGGSLVESSQPPAMVYLLSGQRFLKFDFLRRWRFFQGVSMKCQ